MELGISGKEVDAARKFIKEQLEKRDATAHAKAQAEAINVKVHSQLGVTQQDVSEMKEALKRAEAAGPATTSPEAAEAIAMARETMIRADQAVKAGEVLRGALATKDYDKIQMAVEMAEKLDIRIAELDTARSFLKTLEAAPLPAAADEEDDIFGDAGRDYVCEPAKRAAAVTAAFAGAPQLPRSYFGQSDVGGEAAASVAVTAPSGAAGAADDLELQGAS